MSAFFIGLMSGTSLDGVDGVIADLSPDAPSLVRVAASEPFEADFKAELLALNSPGHNELHRAALAANQLAGVYARVVKCLLQIAAVQGIHRQDITAIGAHGQTVRHQPQAYGTGYTLQLNNPALLAELTGIDVIADFRNADVAAGGQGAPLVPAFHAALWADAAQSKAVLNIGGISNISLLPAGGTVQGFDCGPGNALLDFGASATPAGLLTMRVPGLLPGKHTLRCWPACAKRLTFSKHHLKAQAVTCSTQTGWQRN